MAESEITIGASAVSAEDIIRTLARLEEQSEQHGRTLNEILAQAKQTNGRVNAADLWRATHEAQHEAFLALWREHSQRSAEVSHRVDQLAQTHEIAKAQERRSDKRTIRLVAIVTASAAVLQLMAQAAFSHFKW